VHLKMENIKKIITALILVLICLSILPQVKVYAVATDLGGIVGTFAPPDPISSNPFAVRVFVGTIVNTALFIGLIATLIYIVYGGVRWITAGGDAKALDAARATITQAIIGLILLSTGYAISLVFNAVVTDNPNLPAGSQPNSVCGLGRTCAGTMVCTGPGGGVCSCPATGPCTF
jgi:hypothetical protein